MSKTLGQYKILFDGLNIHEELNFFLKEKLKFNDQDTLINNERILTKHQQNLIEQFLEQKKQGVPLDYILNSTDFYENRFYVDERVLIPRPETEILVDCVNNHLSSRTKVLDAGTGSGCIGISIALKNPSLNVYGSDHSMDALNVALRREMGHKIDQVMCNYFLDISRFVFHSNCGNTSTLIQISFNSNNTVVG